MQRYLELPANLRTGYRTATGFLAVSAALCLAGAWSHSARAQEGSSVAPAAQTATTAAAERESGIDALIQHLHDSFKITPAQEPLWAKVAAVMRENAATLTRLAKARSQTSGTRTAVDDLESYAEISMAHAEGTRKLVPVFQAFYASLSDPQKRAADAEFRDHYSDRGHSPKAR